MAVLSRIFQVAYTSDGATQAWEIPYYFMKFSDLLVMVTTPDGASTAIPFGPAGWEGEGVADSYGAYPWPTANASIVFQPGLVPVAGSVIQIIRHTDKIQPDTYPTYGPLPSTVIMHDLDRLTLIVQEIGGGLGNYLGELPGPPPTGNVCDWFTVCPPVPGGPWGYSCVQKDFPGSPAIWCVIADLSL